jgi:hypothetical protein
VAMKKALFKEVFADLTTSPILTRAAQNRTEPNKNKIIGNP